MTEAQPPEAFALAEIVTEVVMERDTWETIAHERHRALEKLQEDRSHETIRSAVQFARFAWMLMAITLLFAGVIIVANAISVAARTSPCAQPAERP